MKKLYHILFFLLPFSLFSQQNVLDEAKHYIDNDQFKKAEELLKNALTQKQDNLLLIEKLGDVYGHQKNWDKAIEYYKKLVDKKPKVANYQYKYGGVLGMKAKSVSKFKALPFVKNAKEALTKAADLDKNHVASRWALVKMYMRIPIIIGGSTKKAKRYAEELQHIQHIEGYLAKLYIYNYKKDTKEVKKYCDLLTQNKKDLPKNYATKDKLELTINEIRNNYPSLN